MRLVVRPHRLQMLCLLAGVVPDRTKLTDHLTECEQDDSWDREAHRSQEYSQVE